MFGQLLYGYDWPAETKTTKYNMLPNDKNNRVNYDT